MSSSGRGRGVCVGRRLHPKRRSQLESPWVCVGRCIWVKLKKGDGRGRGGGAWSRESLTTGRRRVVKKGACGFRLSCSSSRSFFSLSWLFGHFTRVLLAAVIQTNKVRSTKTGGRWTGYGLEPACQQPGNGAEEHRVVVRKRKKQTNRACACGGTGPPSRKHLATASV